MPSAARLRIPILSLASLSIALLVAAMAFADQPADKPDKDRAEPAAAVVEPVPKAEAPAPAPQQSASVTPEAKQVIELVDAAYARLKRLELAGTYSSDLDAAGQQRKETRSFTATFVAPNKFRHAMQDDILVGSTGEKAYAFLEANKLFKQVDAPKEKGRLNQMLESIPEAVQVLQMQNPSLMFAMAKSAAAELSGQFSEIRKVEDTRLGGDSAAYRTLHMTLPNKMVVTMLFHPETHLLRQARTDIRGTFEARGLSDVKNGTLVVDYTTVKADDAAAVKDEQFAWAPPEGARDQVELATASGAGGPEGETHELQGKPAPAFSLKDMDGKTVALDGLKGKVVVLDLWATWCPPCRASLPHLDKLYEEMKDKGVMVYAVNVQEDKEDVQTFIKQTNLKSPVLLDADGNMSQAYKASGIPQTVVIGKDGKVTKVIVGFGDETPKTLHQAVDEAMK